MKTINNYIIEHNSNHTHKYSSKTNHRLKRASSPDTIRYNKSKIYTFEDENAKPFIYNLNKNEVIWGDNGQIHNDILFDLSDELKEKYKMDDVSFVDELYNCELENYNKCGRIWVIPNNESLHRKYDIYIAWWNELSINDAINYSDKVLEDYNKKFKDSLKEKLKSYMLVTIDGNFNLIDDNHDIIEVKRDDKTRTDDIKKLKNIHLANQSEKQTFFRTYKENKYKKMQTKYWNTTKSKTAAEYNNIKTIGDSLEEINTNIKMKSLIEYILENKSITFGGSGATKENYGNCIILAGGPGSGKGFIKEKILCNYKNVDVDELKKQYTKLVNIGKIEDDYNYEFKNPDDVGKLHQKVKSRKWKSKQRDLFWGQRENKDTRSSGLLPNILFDMVSGDIKDIEEILIPAYVMGYKITIIWVLCNKDTASIGNKIRERRVHDIVIDTGHGDAYKVMTSVFNNEYKDLCECVDSAWIGFSAGYCRKLTDKYANNPVIKVKSNAGENFNYDKSMVDEFLKDKMPINYNEVNNKLNSSKEEKKKQCEEWIKIVGDEYKPNNVKESLTDDDIYSETYYINSLKKSFEELL